MKKLFISVYLVFFILFTVIPAYSVSSVTENFRTAFSEVAKKVEPAVVNITVERTLRGVIVVPGFDEDFFRGTPFEDFFRDNSPRGPQTKEYHPKQRAAGSGVIVTKDGYILTNNHVVQGTDKVMIKLSDGRTFNARIIGTDPKTDLAVIKIKATNLPVATLGDSDKLQVGEWAIAIGQPFGLASTLTAGVISAKGRSGFGAATYEDFVQTDASINPGNSGGPLVNIDGEVIGINTMIIGMGTGIGFAIPINMAKVVMEDLIKHGKVDRPWMGVGIQDLNSSLRKQLQTSQEKGAVVSQIMKNSPAEKAGIKVGDIITKIDGVEIENSHQLVNEVLKKGINKKLTLEVLRDNKNIKIELITAEMPVEKAGKRAPETAPQQEDLGIVVEDAKISRFGQRWFPEKERGDVRVVSVEPGSPAELSGIQVGDIIKEVNRHKIKSTADFREKIANANLAEGILLLISREGQDFFLTVRVE